MPLNLRVWHLSRREGTVGRVPATGCGQGRAARGIDAGGGSGPGQCGLGAHSEGHAHAFLRSATGGGARATRDECDRIGASLLLSLTSAEVLQRGEPGRFLSRSKVGANVPTWGESHAPHYRLGLRVLRPLQLRALSPSAFLGNKAARRGRVSEITKFAACPEFETGPFAELRRAAHRWFIVHLRALSG